MGGLSHKTKVILNSTLFKLKLKLELSLSKAGVELGQAHSKPTDIRKGYYHSHYTKVPTLHIWLIFCISTFPWVGCVGIGWV